MKYGKTLILGIIMLASFSGVSVRAEKLKAHVVPHTHWDREWGFTEEQHLVRGIRLMDNLVEIMEKDARYRYFVLDGQAGLAEDYFTLRPERADRFKKLVREGRILVGPYYVQPDGFLASGESHVRNLLLGFRVAEEAGGVMKTAYEADNFGHFGQLPQVLRGFGIGGIVFSRGIHKKHPLYKSGFRWRAPDGSEVIAGLQIPDYYVFEWAAPVEELATLVTTHAYSEVMNRRLSEHVLFSAGTDAMEPVPGLPDALEKMNKRFPSLSLKISNFDIYMGYLEKEKEKMGLLTGDIRGDGLLGCMSTSMPLKIENHAAFNTLERYAEPFSALMRTVEGRDYPANFIDRAWKYILKSLPHDSVTGTSITLANEDVMIRFRRARRIAEQLSISALKTLYESIDVPGKEDMLNKPVAVFNPNPWQVTGPAEILFPFDAEKLEPRQQFAKEEMKDYIVTDLAGNRMPAFTEAAAGGKKLKDLHTVRFIAKDVPGLGYKTFIFKAVKERGSGEDLSAGPMTMENEFLRLVFNPNGTFDLTDKETGAVYPALHHFEDRYAPGSAWDYWHGGDGPVNTTESATAKLELLENNEVVKSVRVTPDWKITSNRAEGEMIPAGVTSVISMYPGVKRVDIYTEVENRAEDHQFRAAFRTGIAAETVAVDSQFGVFERNVERPNEVAPPGLNMPEYPQLRFVDLAGGIGKGLAVLNRGLPEYEARRGEKGGVTLLLTLFRATVNYTPEVRQSIPDNPRFETPAPKYDAQVQGINRAYYSVYPHAGGWLEGGAHRAAAEFNAPLWPEAVFLADADYWMRGPENAPRYFQFARGKLPPELAYLEIGPPAVMLSALKKAEKDDSLILRVYNVSGKKERAEISFFTAPEKVAVTDLKEEPVEGGSEAISLETAPEKVAGSLDGARISFDVEPYRIVTLKLEVKMAPPANRWFNLKY